MSDPVLIMFDLDETLIKGYMQADDPQAVYRTVRPLNGRVERLTALRAQGTRIAIVTNQAGVGLGYNSEADFEAKKRKVNDIFGFHESGPPVSWHVCYAHQRAKMPEYRLDLGRRKPSPQMLYEALRDHAAAMNPGGPVPAADSLFVGDMESDEQAAFAAGVPYQHPTEFFGRV